MSRNDLLAAAAEKRKREYQKDIRIKKEEGAYKKEHERNQSVENDIKEAKRNAKETLCQKLMRPEDLFDPVKIPSKLSYENFKNSNFGEAVADLYSYLSHDLQAQFSDEFTTFNQQGSLWKNTNTLSEEFLKALFDVYSSEYDRRLTKLEKITEEGEPFELIDNTVFIKEAEAVWVTDYSNSIDRPYDLEYISIGKAFGEVSYNDRSKIVSKVYKVIPGNKILPEYFEKAKTADMLESQCQAIEITEGRTAQLDDDPAHYDYNTEQYRNIAKTERMRSRGKAELNEKIRNAKENGDVYFETQEELRSVYGKILAYVPNKGWLCEDFDQRPDVRDNSVEWRYKILKDDGSFEQGSFSRNALLDSQKEWQQAKEQAAEIKKQIEES